MTTRLLVIRLGAMGDILHASPSLALLPEDVEIHWLTSPLYEPMVAQLPRVNRVQVWNKRDGWAAYCQCIQQLGHFDGVINWQPSLKTWWLARQVCRGLIMTYKKEKFTVSGKAIRSKPRRHAVDDFAQPVYQWLSKTGRVIQPKPLIPVFPWQAEPAYLFESDTYHLGIIPGVGHKRGNRALPLHDWLVWIPVLLRQLHEAGHAVVTLHLFGGPDDQPLCKGIETSLGHMVPIKNHAGQWTILETASLLQQCHSVIGGDTGPTHLAAALGVPVISPFGPTDSRRTGPRGQHSPIKLLLPSENLMCWPCEKPQCHLPLASQMACLDPSQWGQVLPN
jgi:ADP-heptose:LPS heptosyltransferase